MNERRYNGIRSADLPRNILNRAPGVYRNTAVRFFDRRAAAATEKSRETGYAH